MMKVKRIFVFLAAFLGFGQDILAQSGVVIYGPVQPSLIRNRDNLVIFQVQTYSAALDAYTKRTICSVNVRTPDCDDDSDCYDDYVISRHGGGVCDVSDVEFVQRVGYNEAYVIINPGYTSERDNYRVRFKDIRLKNSASSCAASSQLLPNQTINFQIVRGWGDDGDDCDDYYDTPTLTGSNTAFDKFGGKPRLAVEDLLREASEPIAFPTGTVRLESDGQNGVSVVKKPILDLESGLSAKVVAQTEGVRLLVYAKKSGNAQIQVVDLSGRTVFQKNTYLNQGLTQDQLDLNVSSGVYLIRVNDGANQTVVKFVKI